MTTVISKQASTEKKESPRKTLSFTYDGDKMVVTHHRKQGIFKYYEEFVHPDNESIYAAVVTDQRLKAWKEGNVSPFEVAIMKDSCLGWDVKHDFILI